LKRKIRDVLARAAVRGTGLALFTAALLLPATAAQATPPTLLAVGQSGAHLNASWTLPPSMASDFIEVANRPATEADGYFPNANTLLYDANLGDDQTSYVSSLLFPGGVYYVHVAAFDTRKCKTGDEPDCIDEFSAILTFTVPPGVDNLTGFSVLDVPSKQRVGTLSVKAAMGEPGTISAGGSVAGAGASKAFRFKPASAKAEPGKTVKLRLRLPKKALKAVTRALKRHQKVKAKLTVTAKDKARNVKRAKRTVALRL
jgi:hypothetical protein